MRFAGKSVLVTGAASGIGLAAARAFAAEGARVMLADIDGGAAAQAAKDIGGGARSVRADVSRYEDCERMVAETLAAFGALHVGVNNAGIPSGIGGSVEDVEVAHWDRLIAVNLSGVFYSMKAEIPALRAAATKESGGAIVNTGSIASVIAGAGMSPYVAAKHGLAGLTKSAALDLVSANIRVNAICPGVIDTPMMETAPQPIRDAMTQSVPMKRMGTAEEIAQAILFLASGAASYTTGALLIADGGITLA